MNKVYACLAGEWVCLNDDPDSKISEYLVERGGSHLFSMQ